MILTARSSDPSQHRGYLTEEGSAVRSDTARAVCKPLLRDQITKMGAEFCFS